jgi:hypothetical protein
MADAPPPPPSPSGAEAHPFPPPPPEAPGSGRGCLRWALVGCGVLVLLGVLAGVGIFVWMKRNEPALEAATRAAVMDGARTGLETDEAGCLDAARARGRDVAGMAAGFTLGAFVRGCLEHARETAGFCEDVPPPTALRRSMEWKRERCGDDGICQGAVAVAQTYCAGGRLKRTAADTLDWAASATATDALPEP